MPVRVGEERPGHSRRTFLRAALGGAVAVMPITGCDSPDPSRRGRQVPDPLSQLYRDTATLLARFEATIAAVPTMADRLTPLRDDHRAHLEALAHEIGPGLDNPSPAPLAMTGAPTDTTTAVAELLAAEREAAAAARAACLTAPSYRAALLGSIAAARASHAEVLA